MSKPREGCATYDPAPGMLIAHAGGALPDAFYPNNRAAIDLAAKHGFKFIELDFIEENGTLITGHLAHTRGDLTIPDLARWLDAHPGVRIIGDFKSDAVSGLKIIKALAPRYEDRFIPEIRTVADFETVRALGFESQILATFWSDPDDLCWVKPAADVPLFAVAFPIERIEQAKLTRHRVLVHTLNAPMPQYGVYTDCLVPVSTKSVA